MSDPGATYQLWAYTPSLIAAAVFAVVFALLMLVHSIFLIKNRTYFCIPLIVGAFFEVVGYCGRAYAHYKPDSTIPYAMQSLFILLAPILFAASVYMYLGRIVAAINGESHCLIKLRFLTKIFVGGDIFCFLVQGGGGGFMSSAKTASTLKLGENIILAGLILQIVFFIFFCAIALSFHTRMRREPTTKAITGSVSWEPLLIGLYAVSALITIRNVVRAIEYGMGQDGYFLTHEWTTYVFDALLMTAVLVICLVWYRSGVGSRVKSRDTESPVSIPLQAGKHGLRQY